MSIELFNYGLTDLRTIKNESDDYWFVAADVAQILEYRDAHNMTRRLDDEDKGTHSVSTVARGEQAMTVISEAGFYAAILGSQSEKAKAVKRWLTHEVLPALRKTGTYSTAPALTDDELIHKALSISTERVAALTERVAELEPKAEYVDLFVTDSDVLSFSTVASTLDMQASKLRELLIERGWIFKETATRWSNSKGRKEDVNRYSEYSHKKPYFRRLPEHDIPRFRGEVMHTLKFTPEGANAVARMIPRWAGELVKA
ncbi:BRO family protein [Rhodococcus qingshengii]|uniref:BRO family protein n=1 Tax=Rhodococcus qingshengii TaxID=334542 RepID=UPI002AFEEBF7|nr:BRO family protein [Rhodococcus qingshengii]MEA1796715.1 BRO family protein [Rhodococcus qingshengii]